MSLNVTGALTDNIARDRKFRAKIIGADPPRQDGFLGLNCPASRL